MSEWQPIETAPKDGTHILIMATLRVAGKPEEISVVANARWVEDEVGNEFWSDIHGIMSQDDPEYWLPLPLLKQSKGE